MGKEVLRNGREEIIYCVRDLYEQKNLIQVKMQLHIHFTSLGNKLLCPKYDEISSTKIWVIFAN